MFRRNNLQEFAREARSMGIYYTLKFLQWVNNEPCGHFNGDNGGLAEAHDKIFIALF